MGEDKQDIITEIPPIQGKYGCYVTGREKKSFNYPIHRHDAYEINFLYGCKGARRIVGDSIVELDDLDLVFIGPGVEHGWEQHRCTSEKIREITLQFSPTFLIDDYLRDNGLNTVVKLLQLSSNGIAFGTETILQSYATLERLPLLSDSYDKMLASLSLIRILSQSKDFTILSTSTFTNTCATSDSRRISKVQNYIMENLSNKIHLHDLSSLIGMTESSFSRFFKLHTGYSVSDFIINMRLGIATRKLVDTKMTISEICYECGFNNVSHFCRCFRLKKSCSPTEFRKMYHKKPIK